MVGLTRSAEGAPKLELPPGGQKQCVEVDRVYEEEPRGSFIRWKESVVRDGDMKYVASDGKEYTMSLTQTCFRNAIRTRTSSATAAMTT